MEKLTVIDLIEVRYEDGYRYMTQEEFDRLYTMNDLKNTVSALGTFIFQNRDFLVSTFSFFSFLISFTQNVNASTKKFTSFKAGTEVLQESFDREKSYQEFLQRTGNLKTNQTKIFGKSHRLGSSLELENNFSSLLNQTKGVLTLGSFLLYAKKLNQCEGIHFQAPVLNQVKNVVQGGRYLLTLRGGSTLSFFPSFFVYFLFSMMVNNYTSYQYEREIEGLKTSKKRTWRQYLKSYTDFRTAKPYLVLFLLVFIYLGYQNRAHIINILIDAYEENFLGQFPETVDPTAEINESFLKLVRKKKLLLFLKESKKKWKSKKKGKGS